MITVLSNSMAENRLKLLDIVRITANGLPFAEMAAWLRAATSIGGTIVKATRALHELGGRQEHLRRLVRDLPDLLGWESRRRGIPARLVFVPQELDNLHENLSHTDLKWRSPRLTDAQWQLLQETFLNLHLDLDSSRKYRRRKPLPSDRLLLEGILWKLANGLRWQDLRNKYPVRLCQDLYRALCRTGHMQSIFEQLHWHLNVYGEATLSELVERGCFEISGPRVLLSPSEGLTWEKYTALLLLQQGFHVRRTIQWEADLERRRRGNFYRLLAIRLSHLRFQPARPPLPPPSRPASSPMSEAPQAGSGLVGARFPDPPRQMTASFPIPPRLVSRQPLPLTSAASTWRSPRVSVQGTAHLQYNLPDMPDLFSRWKTGLSRSSKAALGRLAGLFGATEINSQTWEELESLLIQADLGLETTESVLDSLRTTVRTRGLTRSVELQSLLGAELRLRLDMPPGLDFSFKPTIILLVGVNGSGKTTTAAKLGRRFADDGKRVLLVAADTFRAAAVDQLQVWAERLELPIVAGKMGSDPGAVVYDGIQSAISRGYDLVLVDTAGRLHTRYNLMEELKKVHRVAGKALMGAPHAVWLVLDATTGQNALVQARAFKEAVKVSGVILAKLDSSARGGMAFAIQRELGLPIIYAGLGEKAEDLTPFDPDAFVQGILGA